MTLFTFVGTKLHRNSYSFPKTFIVTTKMYAVPKVWYSGCKKFVVVDFQAWVLRWFLTTYKVSTLMKAYKFILDFGIDVCWKLLSLENPFVFIWSLKSSFEIWKFNLNLKFYYAVWKFISNMDPEEWGHVGVFNLTTW